MRQRHSKDFEPFISAVKMEARVDLPEVGGGSDMNQATAPPAIIEQLWLAPELAYLPGRDAEIDASILTSVSPELQDQAPADQTAALRAGTVVLDDAERSPPPWPPAPPPA